MSNVPIHSGWHDLDDEVVPVHAAATPAAVPQMIRQGGDTAVLEHPHALSMKLSAITGVAIVLAVVGFYFGIDNLRGSLTGDSPAVTTITITSDGHFSPASVTVSAGSELLITNQNADPQVLKVKTGAELFPVQVIFNGTPFTYAVPVGTNGTFLYMSETLPAAEELSITVTPAIEAAAAASSSAGDTPVPFGDQAFEIPLPFGAPTAYEIPIPFGTSSVSSSSSSSSSVSSSSSSSSGGGSSGGGGGSSGGSGGGGGGGYTVYGYNPGTSPQSVIYANNLPTNPYTVANANTIATRSQELALAEKNSQDLHEGAIITTKRPTSVSKTGGEYWIALIPAFGLMILAYRREQRLAVSE